VTPRPESEASPNEVVVGVDVGTTATKVVAFGLGTTWRCTAIREYPLLQPAPGRQVQDPEVIVTAVVAALAEAVAGAVAGAAGARVIGVSVSTAMHGLLALDDAMAPLTPVITWADSRSVAEAAALRADGSAAELHRTTGTPVHPMTPQTKLMWFARHEPALAARAQWWVGLKDYILYRLTGRLVAELSSASATGLLEMATRQWSPLAAGLAGVRLSQLPPIVATTATLPLAPAVAAAVGLPAGTPVVAGAADGPLGNLGTAAVHPGVAGLSLGTSGAIRAVVAQPAVDAAGRLFCYALTDTDWVVGGAISNGGIVVRWAGEVFGATTDTEALALAAAAPPGSDGLVMLPYLLAERAPLWDPDIPGAFLGVRRHHTRSHFVRAAVEGVCLAMSSILAELTRICPVNEIRATGGTFRAPLWRETMAAALNRPFLVTDGAEGTALGAAALGLYALGRCASLPAGVAALEGPDDRRPVPVPVTPELVATYERMQVRVAALIRAYAVVSTLLDPPVSDMATGHP
jgi:gluconokinase